MSNQIVIQAPAGELIRGKTMKVPVTLRLESPVKVRGIHTRFHGAEETKATYVTTTPTGKGQMMTTTHTAVEHVTITEQEQLQEGRERAGFLGNLWDAVATMVGAGRHRVMPPGEHDYEVEISIPADAPLTHEGNRSRVFYELTGHVDIPAARDLKVVQSFRVASLPFQPEESPVLVRYPDDEGRGFWDKVLTPDVRIELALAKNVLYRGDKVDGIFRVESDEPVEVQAIRARLVGRESSKAHGHTDSHQFKGEAIEVARPGRIQGAYSEQFSLLAETAHDMPVTAKGKLFSINWFVQIELDVPWAKDPTIRAPIQLLPGTLADMETLVGE
jgi:hypothetical protein